MIIQSYINKESYATENEEYEIKNSEDIELIACYEKLSNEELKEINSSPIKINEICASNSTHINEYFQKNDWI